MKKTSYIVSILLSLTSGVLFLILFSSILGGVFEDRTCQTDCMTLLYWSTISAAIISVILSFVAKDNYLSKKVILGYIYIYRWYHWLGGNFYTLLLVVRDI